MQQIGIKIKVKIFKKRIKKENERKNEKRKKKTQKNKILKKQEKEKKVQVTKKGIEPVPKEKTGPSSFRQESSENLNIVKGEWHQHERLGTAYINDA